MFLCKSPIILFLVECYGKQCSILNRSNSGLNNKKDRKIQRTFSQQTRRKIKKKLTSVTPGRKKSSNTEPPNLRKSTPPAIMVHGPSQSSDLG